MNLDFSKICRICLRFCKNYIDLRHTKEAMTLAERIRFCYFIQIDASDGLPTKICWQCVQVLTFFYVTKKNAVASEQMLRNILYVKHKSELNSVESTGKIPDKLVQLENVENMNNEMNEILLLASSSISQNDDSGSGEDEISSIINYQNTRICYKATCKSKLLHSKHKKRRRHNILNATRNTKMLKLKRKRDLISAKTKQGITKQDQPNRVMQNINHKFKQLRELNQNQLSKSQWEMEMSKDESALNGQINEKKQIKVIGTVIDENNILSPDIKRKRTSITGRYH